MNTTLIEIQGTREDGRIIWSWTGECGEKVTLEAPAGLSDEAGSLIMQVYVKAGCQLASEVRAS